MKAVVTGGSGFIGSHLVDELIEMGAEVHVLDNMSSGHIEYVNSEAMLHRIDVRSPEAAKLILSEKPDVIFHLAAQADVSRSINDPVLDAEININGTINLIEACKEASVKKFIFASTSAVYGSLQKERIYESDPVQPISYYGLSKWCAEKYIHVFHNLYGLSYTILRYGNVYGPRQTAKGEGGVMAVFLDRINNGVPLRIHGDGEQTRDFIYVKDVVRANIAALERGNQETFHVSTSRRTSINDVYQALTSIHGEPLEAVNVPARQGDIKHSCLGNEKAKQILAWQPKTDILEGMKATYDFAVTDRT